MSRFVSIIASLIFVLLAGGFVVLATLDVPAPTKPYEKVIPDARFQR